MVLLIDYTTETNDQSREEGTASNQDMMTILLKIIRDAKQEFNANKGKITKSRWTFH